METGKPYCIENVPRAPLVGYFTLCGQMFGLRVYRHRIFECNFPVKPLFCHHERRMAPLGRKAADEEVMQIVGHFPGVKDAQNAMGINWMSRNELSQSVPPAFSRYIALEFDRKPPVTTRLMFSEMLKRKRAREDRLSVDSIQEMAIKMGFSPRLTFDLNHNLWKHVEAVDSMCKYLGCTPGELLDYSPIEPVPGSEPSKNN